MNDTTTPVNVGDQIIPLPRGIDDWYGVPHFYRDKIGTVSIIHPTYVTAEFQSQQKPDDTITWNIFRWRKRPALGDTVRCIDPEWEIHGNTGTVDIDDKTTLPFWVKGFYPGAPNRGVWMREDQIEVMHTPEPSITWSTRERMIGKTIRVIYSGDISVEKGEVHTVTDLWANPESNHYGPKIDGITVGVRPDASRGVVWVQAYEVIEDGQTLTVSYVPAVGDHVRVTGYLADDGIRDGLDWRATVRSIDGLVWTLHNEVRGEFVSGPGYVFPIEDAPALPHEEPRIITELREEKAELERQLTRANERVEEATTRAGKWERDFMRSWERIGREATERQWCSEYERVVSDVEEDLEIGEIPPRVNLVERRVRIRGEVYRDVTVWVQEGEDADDPDNWYESNDLNDHCSDDFMTDQIDSEYNNNGFDETSVTILR